MATDSQNLPLPSQNLRVPSWIVDFDIPMRDVVIPNNCLQMLERIYIDHGFSHCKSVSQCTELITQVSWIWYHIVIYKY
jgi:hypothetical protein